MMDSAVVGKVNLIANQQKNLKEKYLEYCDRQVNYKTLWYLISLMTLAGVVLPICIFLMSYFDHYLSYVGLSVILFYANVTLSVVGAHPRITITTYFSTIILLVLIPLVSFIISII